MLALVLMNGSHPPLSPKQLDILRLCARNLSNREIGRNLDIKATTVDSHLRRVYAKLGVSSRIEAVLLAVYRQELQLGDLVPAVA